MEHKPMHPFDEFSHIQWLDNPLEELSQIQWLDSMSPYERWYDKNKKILSARRKHKYHSDPTYREKILDYQRAQRKAKAFSHPSPQRQHRETFLGQIVRAYSIGEAALLIRRRAQTIAQWERRGLIPPPIFPPPRAYTHHQILLVRELVYLVTKAYARQISNGKVQAEIVAQRAKIFAHWNELPDDPQN